MGFHCISRGSCHSSSPHISFGAVFQGLIMDGHVAAQDCIKEELTSLSISVPSVSSPFYCQSLGVLPAPVPERGRGEGRVRAACGLLAFTMTQQPTVASGYFRRTCQETSYLSQRAQRFMKSHCGPGSPGGPCPIQQLPGKYATSSQERGACTTTTDRP
jgi:hypothetical protein